MVNGLCRAKKNNREAFTDAFSSVWHTHAMRNIELLGAVARLICILKLWPKRARIITLRGHPVWRTTDQKEQKNKHSNTSERAVQMHCAIWKGRSIPCCSYYYKKLLVFVGSFFPFQFLSSFYSFFFYYYIIRRCWLLGTTPIGKQMLLFSMPFPNDLAPFKKLRIPCFGSTPLWNVTRESKRQQRGQHYGVIALCVCACVQVCLSVYLCMCSYGRKIVLCSTTIKHYICSLDKLNDSHFSSERGETKRKPLCVGFCGILSMRICLYY